MPYTLDKPVTEYSISQLLALFNDICRYNGVPGRNSTFRDKASAIKAVQGALVQANTGVDAEDEAPARSPGLARLRASPLADALRASVLADQAAAAAAAAAADRPATNVDPEVVDTSVARRGRSSSLTGNEVITVLVEGCPLRDGSAAADRWAKLTPGMTVDVFGAAVRNRAKAIRDVRWYVAHGFVRLD